MQIILAFVSHTLLVRIQSGRLTVENNLAISYKSKHVTTI
jgi:hypothetical protein